MDPPLCRTLPVIECIYRQIGLGVEVSPELFPSIQSPIHFANTLSFVSMSPSEQLSRTTAKGSFSSVAKSGGGKRATSLQPSTPASARARDKPTERGERDQKTHRSGTYGVLPDNYSVTRARSRDTEQSEDDLGSQVDDTDSDVPSQSRSPSRDPEQEGPRSQERKSSHRDAAQRAGSERTFLADGENIYVEYDEDTDDEDAKIHDSDTEHERDRKPSSKASDRHLRRAASSVELRRALETTMNENEQLKSDLKEHETEVETLQREAHSLRESNHRLFLDNQQYDRLANETPIYGDMLEALTRAIAARNSAISQVGHVTRELNESRQENLGLRSGLLPTDRGTALSYLHEVQRERGQLSSYRPVVY